MLLTSVEQLEHGGISNNSDKEPWISLKYRLKKKCRQYQIVLSALQSVFDPKEIVSKSSSFSIGMLGMISISSRNCTYVIAFVCSR